MPKCNNLFQGKLVPDYDVTKTFKAFIGARTAQQSYGISMLINIDKIMKITQKKLAM